MRKRLRRTLALAPLLSAAVLANALLVPAGASAGAASATPPSESSPPPSESSPPPPESSPPPPAGQHAGRGGKCHLSIEASSTWITAGEAVSLSGTLTCPSGRSAAGEAVTVYERERGAGSALVEVGTARTEADGSYQLTPPTFDTDTSFSVHAERSLGAHTQVKVAPKVTLAGPAPGAQLSTRGDRASGATRNTFTFTGTVSPAPAGGRVALQREYDASGEQWRTIALATIGPEGQYSITHSFTSPGEVSVRVVAHPRGPSLAAASEPLSYDIAQAQNPQLTIEASADPISAGRSLTITGVAAGAASQTVTLLARTRGEGFVAVARSTTDAGGAYSFTTSPLQSTFYRVTVAKTISTELAEGFKDVLTATVSPGDEQTGKLLAQVGTGLTFAGTVVPARAGQVVYLERESASDIGFEFVASATLNAGGAYSIAYTLPDVTTRVMRIRVPPDSESQGATSEPFTILVTPPSPPPQSGEPAQ
jgi:hypothetical protein